MDGMLIIIEKDGVEIEVRRIEKETAAMHFLSNWQISEDVELNACSIETMLLTLNKVINDTKKYIDDLIYPHYKPISQNSVYYRAMLVTENYKELDEYKNLRKLFEFLYDILLNNSNVKVSDFITDISNLSILLFIYLLSYFILCSFIFYCN